MYGHFNPFELGDAWWQHLLMLLVSAVLGYIIGYLSRKGEAAKLEEELAALDYEVEDCMKSKKTSVTVAAPMAPMAETVTVAVPVVEPLIPIVPDDLKVVEGIGPKIEQLLNKEGIMTFKQLAATSPERIKEILVAAGSRFQMHDPTTWPQQSAMAGEGKWDELKAWQNELNKGRKE
ncbi:MAG: hypothetical protein U0X91_09090 [Spirosomataceae bacterium]